MNDEPEDVNNAIHQMKLLLDALENNPRFKDLRERATNEGMDVISYVTSGEVNPTLSSLFNGLDSASGGSIEEILDEIEAEEKEKQAEEIEEKILGGEELSDKEAEKIVDGEVELNPEMLK